MLAKGRKTPDSPALLFNHSSLSYSEFDQHINRTADYLLQSGVRIEDIICVGMERYPELIIAIYAIHKAGAAFNMIKMLRKIRKSIINNFNELIEKLIRNYQVLTNYC
jgi:acyl-coenzyme A synthetase/AMP-(fatty) acid ligase